LEFDWIRVREEELDCLENTTKQSFMLYFTGYSLRLALTPFQSSELTV